MFSSVHISACTFPMAVRLSSCPLYLPITFTETLLSLFSLFLQLCMIFIPTPPHSVPVIFSVPIKFGVRLGTLSAQQDGRSHCDWVEKCDVSQSPYTPDCALRRLLNLIRNFLTCMSVIQMPPLAHLIYQ